MRASHLLSMLLIAALAIAAGLLSQRLVIRADWTYGHRNSLTDASRRVLAALDAGPIEFTAYVYPGPQRAEVRAQLARYTVAAPRVHLQFADPARHPDTVRALGVGDAGVLQIIYQGRRQAVTAFDEATVTAALQRLSTAHAQSIVFVAGHGERSPANEDNGGYSQLAAALKTQGLVPRTLALADTPTIAEDTAVLVIASPQQALLPGEVRLIRDYVARGGTLLWADDPGPRYGLAPLADDLGVHWRDGTLIYPDYRQLGTGHPAMALVTGYPDTPITDHLHGLTLFPFAGALEIDSDADWQRAALLRSSTRSWLETGDLDRGQVSFEPSTGDIEGPLPMAVALGRPGPDAATGGDARQRAVVIADSDFMANGHLERYGNRALALAIFQWLAHRDAQIAVDVAQAPDATLQISPAHIRWLGWLFVLALPGVLLAIGLARWWGRRRR